ncbi:nucleotidyltransferase domain-containing protein [Chromobacterium violaceum]|uniref:nucleotidyltransferase domain-containing protein n=1 Tax=Chromobacterium violaceum TaxID=536 RepID=UPI001CE03C7D|nr:nucleotidyltransferase domain-containing protein [Chromobacterium violaceum]
MELTDLLPRIVAELERDERLHTVLLYGSRADGSANQGSDYDIAALAPCRRRRGTPAASMANTWICSCIRTARWTRRPRRTWR